MNDENLINGQNSVSPPHKNLKDSLATLGQVKNVIDRIIKTANVDREQITTNKEDISSLKEEMGKNFLDDAKTKRSLDALWKLNQGISYQFETDAEKAYQKDIPSGAKLISVKKIGGRTIVWNQMLELLESRNWTAQDAGGHVEFTDGECVVQDCTSSWGGAFDTKKIQILKTHKYYISLCGRALNNGESVTVAVSNAFQITEIGTINSTTKRRVSGIVEASENSDGKFTFGNRNNTYDYAVSNFMLIDLTKMFGAGNEPSTPEEFEALFPEDYYPYNEGTLMSMPVNEVVEKGRNLFDSYGFSCTGIYNENINRSTTNDYGTTISTINPTNSITVTQDKTNSSIKYGYENGYFCAGVRMKNNKEYVMSFDFTPTKMLIDNPAMKLLINGDGSNSSDTIDEFSLNVKKHIVVKFTYKPLKSRQYIEFRNGGMSGIFENFQLEDGATATAYSPYHKNTYPIPQAILNLDGYGDGVSDDVYNYVDWENKEYHKRVGKVDLGSLTYTNNGTASDGSTQWKTKEKISKKDGSYVCVCPAFTERRASGTIAPITNGICDLRDDCSISLGYIGVTNAEDFAQAMQGIMLYYELAEEQIIDISDIIDNIFQEPFEVEAGGTLTFLNSNGDGYRLPIPNEEEYIVSLAEVGGGGASE